MAYSCYSFYLILCFKYKIKRYQKKVLSCTIFFFNVNFSSSKSAFRIAVLINCFDISFPFHMQVTSTDSIMIFSVSSNMEASLQSQIIYFWGIMWIVVSSPQKLSASYQHTRLNILRIFSSSEVTMSVHQSTESMGSMTNVSLVSFRILSILYIH